MSAIAASVGGSKATLYAYFKSKTELFSAVMLDLSEELGADKITHVESGADIAQALRTVARNIVNFICQPEAMAIQRLVIGEAGRFPELGEVFFLTGPKAKIEWIRRLLHEAMEQGALRRGDPTAAAEQFFALCRSGVYHNLLWNVAAPPTPAQLQSDADRATQVFLDAYRPDLPPLV